MRKSRYAGRRGVAAALAGAAILGSVAACSSSAQGGALDGLSADQIASRATADLKVVSSVHVKGSVQSSGQTIALNLTLGTQGCSGTMGIEGEGSFVLLKIGKTLWIKPDDKFWKHAAAGSGGSAVTDLFSGKYIKPSAKGSSLASIGALCNPAQFAKSFGSNMTGMVKGTSTTIAGQPALQIKDSGDAASAFVTVDAKPQFLRLDGGGSNGRLDFTDYNAPLHLTAPPAAETLDGAKYGF